LPFSAQSASRRIEDGVSESVGIGELRITAEPEGRSPDESVKSDLDDRPQSVAPAVTLTAAASQIPTCPECGSGLNPDTEGCPQSGAQFEEESDSAVEFLGLPEMRYQNAYVWLVLVASLDVVLTMLVLNVWKGHEVNPIAAAVIEAMGFGWAIAFKYGLIILVIVICEIVGRRDDRVGLGLSILAVLLNVVPVVYTFALLMRAGPAVAI